MIGKEKSSILTLLAVSPIHAGTGQALAAIDLPIQRERHTQWPHIQASGMKGAMREHFRRFAGKDSKLINLIFGSDYDNDHDVKDDNGKVITKYEIVDKENKRIDSAGAISVSDAKLFAFPMRSNISPFVLVTCPAVLKRLQNDLNFCGIDQDKIKDIKISFEMEDDKAFVLQGNCNGKIILEDAEVEVMGDKKEEITAKIPFDLLQNIDNLLLISDSLYNYCVTSCTEIQINIKIDAQKGTASDGALRYQELLPSDSVLYSVVYFTNAVSNDLQSESIYNAVKGAVKDFIQVGGDATLGRGICKVGWIG